MKCGWCGRFISYTDRNAIRYANYGGYIDLEPPEPIDVCGRCRNKLSEKKKAFYRDPKEKYYPATKLFGDIK